MFFFRGRILFTMMLLVSPPSDRCKWYSVICLFYSFIFICFNNYLFNQDSLVVIVPSPSGYWHKLWYSLRHYWSLVKRPCMIHSFPSLLHCVQIVMFINMPHIVVCVSDETWSTSGGLFIYIIVHERNSTRCKIVDNIGSESATFIRAIAFTRIWIYKLLYW